MERFYNDDSENNEPFFGFEEDKDEFEGDISYMNDGMFHKSGIMQAMQIDIAEIRLSHEILDKAIRIAEKRWFWSFKSHLKKVETIQEIYYELMRIVSRTEPIDISDLM